MIQQKMLCHNSKIFKQPFFKKNTVENAQVNQCLVSSRICNFINEPFKKAFKVMRELIIKSVKWEIRARVAP